MEEELLSFTGTLSNLKANIANKRDPRHVRLLSVIESLSDPDVIEGDVTPTKLYASAVTTLEGTLHQQNDNALDSLMTQAALLEVIRLTLPHVSSGVAAATLPSTFKVLRYVLSLCKSVAVQESGRVVLETTDELGVVTSLVCKTCLVASEFMKRLPSSTSAKNIKSILHTFIFAFVGDTRSKVKTVVTSELCHILGDTSIPCHPSIYKETTNYIGQHFDKLISKRLVESQKTSLLDLLEFTRASIMLIDFSAVGSKLMVLLLKYMGEISLSQISDFIAEKRDASEDIAIINAILSTMLSMLEFEKGDPETINNLTNFSARVLASLVQETPSLTFAEGMADDELLSSGRTIYGQVMLSSCQRLLENNNEAGFKLLPLAIQQLLNLSKANDPSSAVYIDGGTVMSELSQIIRIHIGPLKTTHPSRFETCSRDCLHVLQNVLSPVYRHTWSSSLLTLAILLQQMETDHDDVKACVQSLLAARSTVNNDKKLEDAVDGSIRSLVQGIGVQKFWEIAELTKFCSSQGNQVQLHWLFDTMKSSGNLDNEGRLELAFFQEKVLHLARHFDMLAMNSPEKSTILKGQVVDLWALFPSFCRYPNDIAESFPKMAPLLIRAMNDDRYPQLVSIISDGLTILVKGVCSRFEMAQELDRGEEDSSARLDAETVRGLLERLLPSLFKLIDTLHAKGATTGDGVSEQGIMVVSSRVHSVSEAIASMARLCPASLLNTLSSKLIQRLLEASQSEEDLSVKVCSLLTLAQALVVSETLEESTISLLYRSLKPLIRTDETTPKVQKRAYKLLSEICSRYDGFVSDKGTVKELLDLLTSTSGTSQTSARSARLKCLHALVNALDEGEKRNKETLSKIVGEVLLCMKDSNTKTRDAAFKLLFTIVEVQGDTKGVIEAVAACMASNTSHMRSAAVMAMSRLVFECSQKDEQLLGLLPSLLKTVLVLSDDPSREVFKSVVGFVRVSVGIATPEQFEPLLPDILGSLLNYGRGKDRFRAKIKIIIKKLVKSFGYESLMPYVPASDTRLLIHMRKLSEREIRRRSMRREEQKDSLRLGSANFDEMVGSDEEDSDDGRTLLTAATRMSRMTKQSQKRRRSDDGMSEGRSSMYSKKSATSVRIKDDVNGEVQDMTDLTRMAWNVDDIPSDASDSDDDDVRIDDSGMIVVSEAPPAPKESSVTQDLMNLRKHKKGDAKSVDTSRSAKSKGGRKKSRQQLGEAYKAKKAGGDSKKKGQKYDPYAYVPLDGRSYTKKNRNRAVEQMSSVVRGRKRQKR